MDNLKELCILSKEKYPDAKIGFTKYAELRPKNYILVGSKGTDTVCACTIQQNIEQMIEYSKIKITEIA